MLVIFCRSVLLLSSSSRSLPGPSTVEVNTTECQRWSRCGTVTLPVCCADRRRSAVAVPNMAGARLFHWLDFTEAKQPPEWLVFSATTTGSNSPKLDAGFVELNQVSPTKLVQREKVQLVH